MDQISRSVDSDFTGLDRRGTPHGPFRRFLRDFIHFFSYHLILSRQSIRTTRAAGFRLRVRPTVFHPRFFLSSEFFAKFLDGLDLSGKSVCDIGTGSGILALAAARAGAAEVLALDINPHAALSALENAQAYGFGDRVSAACMNLWRFQLGGTGRRAQHRPHPRRGCNTRNRSDAWSSMISNAIRLAS